MPKKLLSRIAHLAVFGFFLAGLWVLYRELGHHHFRDIAERFTSFPKFPILIAALLTAANYTVLTGYDWLGLRYAGRPLGYSKIVLASFMANALGNSVGAAALSGAAIRYRMYSAWGLSAIEAAKVILFFNVTFMIGLVVILAYTFLAVPVNAAQFLHLPLAAFTAAGIFLAITVLAYYVICSSRRVFKFKDNDITLPGIASALGQTAFSLLDWVLAGAVLYALIPSGGGLSFPVFLCVFVLAQTFGMVSQVPAGLGVFEATIMTVLRKNVPADVLFTALLYYRFIYYLLPLAVSLVFMAVFELGHLRDRFKKLRRKIPDFLTLLAPTVLSFTTFIAGTLLLLSGATPAVSSRLAFLDLFLPLPAIEASHFLGSLAGVGLLFLARGIQRRLDAAYYLTLTLLGAGILFSLVKGFDYEEAIILFSMFVLLLPCRSFFYRKASLTVDAFSPNWLLSIMTAITASGWLMFFVFKHVDYSHHLWWRFGLDKDVSRSMRALVGVIVFAALFAIWNLLKSARIKAVPPSEEDLMRAIPVIENSTNANAHLALMGDKSFLFSRSGRSFLMYAVHGKSWVALGDPIGLEHEWPELIAAFRTVVDMNDGAPVFSEISAVHLPLYLDFGLALLKAGEEAWVPLQKFTLEGSDRKELRQISRHSEKEGLVFERIAKENVPAFLSEFKKVSDAWLNEKNTKEKGFSLGFFSERYLANFPAAVIRYQNEIVAFTNLFAGAEKKEFSMDLIRYDPARAPSRVTDCLLLALILSAKQEGYHWFSLGMAPLSGLENREFSPLWNRIGAFIFTSGEHFYNFGGVRKHKEKFCPVWKPKYIALQSGFSVPAIIADIAALNSGGLKGIFSK